MHLQPALRPDPNEGAHCAPPDSIAGYNGAQGHCSEKRGAAKGSEEMKAVRNE